MYVLCMYVCLMYVCMYVIVPSIKNHKIIQAIFETVALSALQVCVRVCVYICVNIYVQAICMHTKPQAHPGHL